MSIRSCIATAFSLLAFGAALSGASAQESTGALVPVWESLSPTDQSTLPTALRAPDSVLMTMEGSPNSAFWAALAERGWLAPVDPPDGLTDAARTYRITEDGRVAIAAFLNAHPPHSTEQEPKITFYEDVCGTLFENADTVYSRPADEMPMVAMFALGYYSAAASVEGIDLAEIANRPDVIPNLRRHCLDRPEATFLDALSRTIPARSSEPTGAASPVLFGGPCDDVFGTHPRPFKGSPVQYTMLVHFALGYYTAKGVDWQLNPADLDDRRDLMPMLYDACMKSPDQLLTDALDTTVPGAP